VKVCKGQKIYCYPSRDKGLQSDPTRDKKKKSYKKKELNPARDKKIYVLRFYER
jgi:hypothetical protein